MRIWKARREAAKISRAFLGIAMQYKIFVSPIPGDGAMEEMNRYIATNRVIWVKESVVQSSGVSYVVFIVHSTNISQTQSRPTVAPQNIDYQKRLTAIQYERFNRLRDLRGEIAKSEGVPRYAIFNNEQIEAMIVRNCSTLAELSKISGIGSAKIEKYGQRFIELIASFTDPPTPE